MTLTILQVWQQARSEEPDPGDGLGHGGVLRAVSQPGKRFLT